MNSRNKIILGCLSLLVIASVGYALFSEKIQINGSAKAKSDMDVVVTSCSRIGVDVTEDYIKAHSLEGQIKPGDSVPNIEKRGEGTCEILEDGTIKTRSKLNKPTDEVWYSVFIKNNGKLPIKIKEVNSSNNLSIVDVPNTPGRPKIGDEYYYDGFTGELDEKGNLKGWTGLYVFYYLNELDEQGTLKYPMFQTQNIDYNPMSDSSIEQGNIIIPSNQSIYIHIEYRWVDLVNQVVFPSPKNIDYKIQLVFEQVA